MEYLHKLKALTGQHKSFTNEEEGDRVIDRKLIDMSNRCHLPFEASFGWLTKMLVFTRIKSVLNHVSPSFLIRQSFKVENEKE